MTAQTKTVLKSYFETNDKPSEAQFASLIDTIGGAVLVAANDAPDVIKGRADYVCDGTADNVEIQAAVDSYKLIRLSQGNFSLSTAVTIAGDNISLIGSGVGTALALIGGLNVDGAIIITGDYCELSHLKIDSNGANQSNGWVRNLYINGSIGTSVYRVYGVNGYSHGFDVEGCQDIVINSCMIRDFDVNDIAGDGISITDAQNNIVLTNNIISKTLLGVVSTSGIEAEDGAYNLIVDGNVITGTHNGINIHVHAGNVAAHDVIITRNLIYSVDDYGIRFSGLAGQIIENCIVSNNIVHGCGESGILLGHMGGIVSGNVSHSNDIGIFAGNCSNLLITANQCLNNTSSSVTLGTGNSGVTKANNIGDDI